MADGAGVFFWVPVIVRKRNVVHKGGCMVDLPLNPSATSRQRGRYFFAWMICLYSAKVNRYVVTSNYQAQLISTITLRVEGPFPPESEPPGQVDTNEADWPLGRRIGVAALFPKS